MTLSPVSLQPSGSTNGNITISAGKPFMDVKPGRTVVTRHTDSPIQTHSRNSSNWKNGGVNLTLHHAFTAKRELTADAEPFRNRTNGSCSHAIPG